MAESGAKRETRTFKVQLSLEALKKGLDPSLGDAIGCFEPLAFDAANEAIGWLRTHVSAPQQPVITVLEIDADENHLVGFFVLRYIRLRLTANPKDDHLAAEVGWIARSAGTDSGYGEGLFEYAVTMCMDDGIVGMVVNPYDDETAKKVWVERFQFEPAAPEDQLPNSPPWLWYPIDYPGGWSNGGNGASRRP